MCACSVVSAKHDFIELPISLTDFLLWLFHPFCPPLPQRSLGTGVRGGFNLFLNYSSAHKKRANFSISSASQDKKIPIDFADFQVVFVINKVCDETHRYPSTQDVRGKRVRSSKPATATC